MNAHRAWLRTFQMLAILAVLAWGLSPAVAVHDGIFEIDRNASNDGYAGDDWTDVNCTGGDPTTCDTPQNGGGGSSFVHTGFIQDPVPENSIFRTGGSKDNNDISEWRWVSASNILDKDNISNAYAAAYTCPVGATTCTPGDLILYFGLDRVANNGTAQVGFWFFKGAVGLEPDGTFSGGHQDGDILVQSNFTGGGVISTVTVFQWRSDGLGSNGFLDRVGDFGDCLDMVPGDPACATVNRGDTPAPWPYTPKFGSPGVFPQGSFFEGGINVTALGLGTCVSMFMAETRSSAPFDSQLKDFVGPIPFQTCGINATKTCTATVTGSTVTVVVEGTISNTGTAQVTHLAVSDTECSNVTLGSNTLAPKGLPGDSTTFSCTYTSTTAANSDTATVTGTAGGETYTAEASATCDVTPVRNITVTKTCSAAVNGAGNAVNVSFSGQVCNPAGIGVETLNNVSLSDNKPGTLIPQSLPTLAPGECVNYSGTYTSATQANSDTVTASGTGAISGTAVSNTGSAACTATITEGIDVAKTCANVLETSAVTGHLEVKVNFSGTVTNTGNVQLNGVSVNDSQAGAVTCGSGTLAPGTSCSFSGSYYPTSLGVANQTDENGKTGNGLATDTVTASSTASITGDPISLTNPASCNLCPLQ